MAVRTNQEKAFVDVMLEDLGGPRASKLLARLDQAVPWEKIVRPILRLPEYRPNPKGGRPAWSPVVMLKSLLLAKWFKLSDPALEDALQDRISFRRFVGLAFNDTTPDETSFVVFRNRLRDTKLHDTLFDAVVRHIEKQGLLVKEGTMVDATIIEQSRGEKREDGTSTRDEDATFTKKHGKTYHGYKGHIAVDRSKIITRCRFSTAKDHDSRYIDELTKDERVAVYADSAYDKRERRQRLRRRGVIDAIVYQRRRGQESLAPWQKRWNDLVARFRAPVEHPIGHLKQHMGYRKVRYRGLARNALDFCLTAMAYNIRRSVHLTEVT